MNAVLITLIIVVALAGAVAFGRERWRRRTRELYRRIVAASVLPAVSTVRVHEVSELPPPVQRYLRAVLPDGQALVAGADITHKGTFNMSDADEQWKPFTSAQHVVTGRPGFVWNAKIRLMPGVHAFVHDAYVAGEGILQASALGLVRVVNQRGDDDLAHGELMRFLAEAVWYPTVLLPGNGVTWDAIDDHSARATLADGDVAVSLIYRFDDQSLVESVEAPARVRTVDGETEPTPWRGRFWNYEARSGIRIPIEGEVAWVTAEGEKPYWRGRIAAIEYYFAKP